MLSFENSQPTLGGKILAPIEVLRDETTLLIALAGIYYYINNGQIWADTVADEFAVSIQDMAKSFGSTQILM